MSRRKNGEGTIYRRQRCRRRAHHGGSRCGGRCRCLWVGELTLGYEGGRRIKKTYANKDLAALQRALNNGKFIIDNVNAADGAGFISGLPFDCDDKGYTVASWVSYWLDTYKRPAIKLSTFSRYNETFRFYINPYVGEFALGSIRADDIQRFYNRLQTLGLSRSTIKKSHVILSQAFSHAVRDGLLVKSPCENVVVPKSDSRKPAALTTSEQSAFVSVCSPSNVYGAFFLFALNTGLRCGEIIALTWSDVDFDNRAVSVNKTAYNVPCQGVVVSTPKTKNGYRQVPMNGAVYNLLVRHAAHRAASQSHGVNPEAQTVDNGGLVFPSNNGKYLLYRNVLRALSSTVKRSGITKRVTVHTLRHTFATRLLENGVDVKTISELLGHASVQITLDVYAHVSDGLKRSAVETLGGFSLS